MWKVSKEVEVRVVRSRLEGAAAEVQCALALLDEIDRKLARRDAARFRSAIRTARDHLRRAKDALGPPSFIRYLAEKTVELQRESRKERLFRMKASRDPSSDMYVEG